MLLDVLMKVLLDCFKELQIVLEGFIGLYFYFNNCILEEYKFIVVVQEQIIFVDRGFFIIDSWNGVVKKLNEVVYCMSQQKIYVEEQKWKQFLIRYKKIIGQQCLIIFFILYCKYYSRLDIYYYLFDLFLFFNYKIIVIEN